ncbi:ATPase, P-type (transporting), HAD superfamily, subfamily IC (plasmid) [Gemmatirosa kalamazoonensis]|uniref:ATPase, P-type (Transporting), HAD superfamily, subfamily IC n=1 Tax=Gemmatirosa kalamazoonensis TaxID=861299 RepID=W0RR80_9BACT|nr:cation-translocating P-type ATPase [Gemmatirosa kalamazoonensis]AHG92820.1 ATPase, P-type (transporting), HAD superfamily, subfamily IC [Gemmatirosa kalamazoonensis]
MTAVHHQSVAVVAAALDVDPRRGLSETEARARLARAGRNELEAAPAAPAWRRFLAQFQDVLVLLLLAATAISTALWLYERDTALPYESIAILAVVLLNAAMGYIQEARAEAAVAALRAMSAAEATVVRDGERRRVPAAELVPGDVVLIEEGDTIPADARLVESTALQTAEAALTGESLPVSKDPAPLDADAPLGDRHDMVFSGTAATYGRGRAIVTATGMRTEMGHIAGLLKGTRDEATPLQRELDRTGKLLGLVVVVIAVVMIATIILVEDVRGFGAIVDVLILGVALAVAAVPEGLPAVVTAVLSIGVQRMARRNAVVRHLAAVETLGSASVIASDKTGTLTRNEMTVRVVATASGRVTFGGTGYAPLGEVTRDGGGPVDGALRHELERALAAADRANNAAVTERDGRWTVQGDPTEGALLVAARKAGLRADTLGARFPRVAEVPFSSERKLMSTVHRDTERAERVLVFTKGAPDVLLGRCTRELVGDDVRPLTPERRAEIARANEALAGEALRTLGVAARFLPSDALDGDGDPDPEIERDLAFAGLIGMIDPPRPEARQAVARARRAGVRPVMITGDHPRTASVIAQELGIADDDRVVTGAELEALPEAAREHTVRDVSVYARVAPEHKLRIVKALQRGGAIVAMTGDGVNDAPALKTADIGVAMGITGTDVSKEAADIVLADDDFATIVAAVEEGRAIFDNIRKFLRFLLSSNIGEVLTMFFGVLLAERIGLRTGGDGTVLPLLATQILWVNLLTDVAPALALGVDPADAGLMERPPRPAGERVITPRMWRGIAFVGVVTAAVTLLVLDASLPGGFVAGTGTVPYAQTMTFTTLVLAQLFNVFNARSDERSAFRRLFTNRWLWGSIGAALALQALVLYAPPLQRAFGTVPLGAGDWLRCVAAGSAVLWLREVAKLVGHRRV